MHGGQTIKVFLALAVGEHGPLVAGFVLLGDRAPDTLYLDRCDGKIDFAAGIEIRLLSFDIIEFVVADVVEGRLVHTNFFVLMTA